jgi:hypothetical protein
MITMRNSAPKSRRGCQTCKYAVFLEVSFKCSSEATQHSSRPLRRRTASLSTMHEYRCDGYAKEGSSTPPTSLPASVIAVKFPSASFNSLQERRSFDIFLSEIVPIAVVSLDPSLLWSLALQASSKEPAVSQAELALGVLHERLFVSLLPVDTPSEQHSVST